MKLTSENVRNILMDCFAGELSNDNIIQVEGITKSFGLDKEKLDKHADEIYSMLIQLPSEFKQGIGGGYSFLQACIRDDGVQWGEHINIEELFVLGIGINKGKFLLPRELWNILPGGLPYYVVIDE